MRGRNSFRHSDLCAERVIEVVFRPCFRLLYRANGDAVPSLMFYSRNRRVERVIAGPLSGHYQSIHAAQFLVHPSFTFLVQPVSPHPYYFVDPL